MILGYDEIKEKDKKHIFVGRVTLKIVKKHSCYSTLLQVLKSVMQLFNNNQSVHVLFEV